MGFSEVLFSFPTTCSAAHMAPDLSLAQPQSLESSFLHCCCSPPTRLPCDLPPVRTNFPS